MDSLVSLAPLLWLPAPAHNLGNSLAGAFCHGSGTFQRSLEARAHTQTKQTMPGPRMNKLTNPPTPAHRFETWRKKPRTRLPKWEILFCLSNCEHSCLTTAKEMLWVLLAIKIDGGFARDNAPRSALSQVPWEPRGGSADLGGGNGRGQGSLGGMRNWKSGGEKMTEFSRALIVKLRERKGWDLSPGNYAEMKNRWIHKEVASNNKFEVSSKLFTSSQAFDQHPPSCPQNTRSPSEAATAAAASAASAATAAVLAAAARLQPSPARLPLSPAPCLSCVCVCVCSATAWGAPARLGSQRRKPRRELQLLPPLVLPLAGAGLPAAAAAAWSAGVGLRGASPLAASVLPGCLQVSLAASHVSVPEAETERKKRASFLLPPPYCILS